MARMLEKVKRRLPDAVAATSVQPLGSTAAMLAATAVLVVLLALGLGLFGMLGAVLITGIHRFGERRKSGLPLPPYMVLVVTEDRVHLFKPGFRWSLKQELASWDRRALFARVEAKPLTLRITLDIPSEERQIGLEAVRGSAARGFAEAVATVPPRPDLAADTI